MAKNNSGSNKFLTFITVIIIICVLGACAGACSDSSNQDVEKSDLEKYEEASQEKQDEYIHEMYKDAQYIQEHPDKYDFSK